MKVSNLLLAVGAAALISQGAYGRHLSADEALELATATATGATMRVAAERLHLAYAMEDDCTGEDAVYVFGSDNGFMVVAADDAYAPLVMGVSDEGSFDAGNIPPAMAWWLKAASATVSRVAAESRQGLVQTQTSYNAVAKEQGDLRRNAPRKVRASIGPLVSTKWDQGEPYNNLCPEMTGGRAVTGCVATAMAQVMKYYNYPTKGTGSKTYSWKNNNRTYSASANFGSTTYDWANMTNTYSQWSTAKQKTAVSMLMFHCGVASSMNYSPEGSGTSDFEAAKGLVDYFDYDKSINYCARKWYTAEEWDDLIYGQLSEGKPLMYSGNDGESGHEFVCDGYNTMGLFHINWGWGGAADGYFELSNLDPYTQGIGGGTGDDGFNYGQAVLADMFPSKGNSEYVPKLAIADDQEFTTAEQTYTRNRTTQVQFPVVYYSYAIVPTEYVLGVWCKGETVDTYLVYGATQLETLYGINGLEIRASDFPVGEYDVYPAFNSGDKWYLMDYNRQDGLKGSVHMKVTDSEISIGEVKTALTGTFDSWRAANGIDETFYPGHKYIFTFDLASTTAWKGDIYLIVFDNTPTLVAYSDPVAFDFASAGSKKAEFALSISANVTPDQYKVSLAYLEGGMLHILDNVYTMNIYEAPAQGVARATNVTFAGSSTSGTSADMPAILAEDKQEITVTMQCTKPTWSDDVGVVFADPTTLNILLSSQTEYVTLTAEGETRDVVLDGPWPSLEISKLYALAVWGDMMGQLSGVYYFRINPTTGVGEILTPEEAWEYFNLQGMPVAEPGRGLYLRRNGNRAEKVFVNE